VTKVRIERLKIGHFRSLRDFEIQLDQTTILVGRNGVGKSTVLHALAFFLDTGLAGTDSDFHGECKAEDLSITVTFGDLLGPELERFAPYVIDGKLTLTKRCSPDHTYTYTATRTCHPPFSEIRGTSGPGPQRSMYRTFCIDNPDYNLPSAASASIALKYLEDWELGLAPVSWTP
jgi:hypothetical protein